MLGLSQQNPKQIWQNNLKTEFLFYSVLGFSCCSLFTSGLNVVFFLFLCFLYLFSDPVLLLFPLLLLFLLFQGSLFLVLKLIETPVLFPDQLLSDCCSPAPEQLRRLTTGATHNCCRAKKTLTITAKQVGA